MGTPVTRRQALKLLAAGLVAGRCAADRPPASRVRARTTTTGSPGDTATTTLTAPLPPPPPPTTAPPPLGPVAGFVAFGDFGGGPAQQEVADAMGRWIQAGHRVDALVTTGDNVYDHGEPELFAAQLDEPYRALREGGRPLWVTLGNHDVERGHGGAQLAHLGLPPLPYATSLPGVRLLFLDGNRPDLEQARWLDQQLTEGAAGFSVVVFHQPVHSCGLHGPTPSVARLWEPVLEARRASLVLNGHDHLYQRFVSPDGVTYVVSGGGGRPLYDHRSGCQPSELRASSVRHHFTAVEVHPDRLVLTAVAADDEVLDRAEIAAPVPAAAGAR